MVNQLNQHLMNEGTPQRNSWFVVSTQETMTNGYSVTLAVELSLCEGMDVGDGVVVSNASREVTAFGRIYRKRSTMEQTTLYLDAVQSLGAHLNPNNLGITINTDAPVLRLQWDIFEQAMIKSTGTSFDSLKVLEGKSSIEQAYLRDLMQLATIDDLLGPANGPTEDIVGMSVRDRYLVGKLAPRDPIASTDGPTAPSSPPR